MILEYDADYLRVNTSVVAVDGILTSTLSVARSIPCLTLLIQFALEYTAI